MSARVHDASVTRIRRRPSSKSLERASSTDPKPIAVVVCYPRNPTAYVAGARLLQGADPVREAATASSCCPASGLCGGLFRRSAAAFGAAGSGARSMSPRSSSPSLSKTYSMPGWRIGFAVGKRCIIAAWRGEVLISTMGVHTRSRWPRPRPFNTAADAIHGLRAIDKRRATCWSTISGHGRAWPVRHRDAFHVRLAPLPEPVQSIRQASTSPSSLVRSRRRGFARHRLWRIRGRICGESPWSRTSSASARPPQTSGASLKARGKLHNVRCAAGRNAA